MSGLPPGGFELDIFEAVLNRITICGSIAGIRKDLQESIDVAFEGQVNATVNVDKPEHINSIFDSMKKAEFDGRIIVDMN